MAGVLGGAADLLGIDSSLLRVAFMVIFVFTAFFPLALIYILWIFIVPNEEDVRLD